MALSLKRIGAAGVEPVTLAQMKQHLNIEATFTDDDDLISGMVSAARQDAEDFTGQSFCNQQWIYALDFFPMFRVNDYAPSRSDFDAFGSYNFNGFRHNHSQIIVVPVPPLMSVDAVQYTDVAGVKQTVDPSTYQVDAISMPGRIAPLPGNAWPTPSPILNAVEITFTSGHSTPPFRTSQAIKLRAAAYYANREEFLAGAPTADPGWFERMLSLDRTSIFGFVHHAG